MAEKTYYLKMQHGEHYQRRVPPSVAPGGWLTWSKQVPVCPVAIPRSIAVSLLEETVTIHGGDGNPRSVAQRFTVTTKPVEDVAAPAESEKVAALLDNFDALHGDDEEAAAPSPAEATASTTAAASPASTPSDADASAASAATPTRKTARRAPDAADPSVTS